MPHTATKSTPAADKGFASPILGDSDPDCLHGDPQSIARATQAAQASHRSGRRQLVDPTTCERDYAVAELEFMQAIQEYKQQSGRMFPTWSEVLEVLLKLGYEKTTREGEVPGVHSMHNLTRKEPHLKPDKVAGRNRKRQDHLS